MILSALRLSLLAAALGAALSAHAGLLGSTVHVDLDHPAQGTVSSDLGDAVVGPAVEYTDSVESLSLDFTDTTLRLTSALSGPFVMVPFNGYDISVVSPGLRITGASLAAGSAFAPVVTVSGGHLFVNFGGNVSAAQNAVATIDITTQAVPEPSAFAALGLGTLAMLRRRRK